MEVSRSLDSTTWWTSSRSGAGSTSQMTRPRAAIRSWQRLSRASRSPPIPMLLSTRSAVPQRPSAGSGSLIRRCRASPPRVMLASTAADDMSTPRADRPERLQRNDHPTGTATEVDHGRLAPGHHHAGRRRRRRCSSGRRRAPRASHARTAPGSLRRRRLGRTAARPAARAGRPAVRDAVGRTRATGSGRPRARHPRAGRHRAAAAAAARTGPESISRASWAAPVRSVDMGIPSNTCTRIARAQPDGPEPAVLAQPEDRVGPFPVRVQELAP